MYMAVLSELKIFYLEIVLLFLVLSFLYRKSYKVITMAVIVGVITMIGIWGLYEFFPKFDGYFNLDNIMNNFFSKESYGSYEGLSRSTQLSYVWNHFLSTWKLKWFGIGFGNAEYSGLRIFTSPFYLKNWQSSYQWFCASFIFTETGILGLLVNGVIYINYIYTAFKAKVIESQEFSYKIIAMLIGCLALGNLFYDQTLKIETSGYLVVCILSFPYIIQKETGLVEERRLTFRL
ncbi:EpsP [Lachnospiraceae bacterium TWA4]|nr:EpsP [Lachnospiraceae bacterium TWA4]